VGLTNLGRESETCVGSRVRLVGVFISFEKNFYRLPFTPPSLVRRIGPSHSLSLKAKGHIACCLEGTGSMRTAAFHLLCINSLFSGYMTTWKLSKQMIR
jgi:hypothetical protein